ncbi:GntR family transcriptional regulator [Ligaoa zhengdingensis]|uniref:GntR family transcriptional regulator n=1 Tax=Ligaoa zhengdingensis TaxID=2763658 RepID=UPI0031BA6898
MGYQDTQFSYLYQNLKAQITSGYLRPGSRLLSTRQLCQVHQVGARTVSGVLAALKAEGYIDLYPRRAAVVRCWRAGPDPAAAALTVLAKRDSLIPLYQTMAVVLPSLLVFAAQGCALEELPHFGQPMRTDREEGDGWRTASSLCRGLLRRSGNPLFSSLYITFESNGHLAFFVEEQKTFTGLSFRNISPKADWMTAVLSGGDPLQKFQRLTATYRNLAAWVAESIKLLEIAFPGCSAQPEDVFLWNIAQGRNHCYNRIARDLMRKIRSRQYQPGAYLPYEAELAAQYGVSVSTVRSALALLGRLGFSKTLNAKGTIALLPEKPAALRALQAETDPRDLMLYLFSLQFMALVIRPAALLAAPRLSRADCKALEARFDLPGATPLTDVVTCLLDRLELGPLRAILTEAHNLSQWGYYLTFCSDIEATSINQASHSLLDLLQAGNIRGFADGLAGCYCRVLDLARQFTVERFHLAQARAVATPQLRL